LACSAAGQLSNESRNGGTDVELREGTAVAKCGRSFLMDGIIYLVGLIVIILAVLSFLAFTREEKQA
jgi:hypothetical protein